MIKKIIAFMLSVVFILYFVSFGIVIILGIDAKEEEFLTSDYLIPYYDLEFYTEGFESGKLTFDDTVNGLMEYDTKMLRMPTATHSAVLDSEGNIVSQSKSLLKIRVYSDEEICRLHYIDLDKYIDDSTVKKLLEITDGKSNINSYVHSVELHKENDTYIPVALNLSYYDDDFEKKEYRIILSGYQTDTQYFRDGNEAVDFELIMHRLDGEREVYYDYLEGMVSGYSRHLKEGNIIADLGGFDSEEPYIFTVTYYSVSPVILGGETYYLFTSVSVNTLEAVFADETYKKSIITLTCVHAFFAAVLSFAGVHLYNKKESDTRYADKYTGML